MPQFSSEQLWIVDQRFLILVNSAHAINRVVTLVCFLTCSSQVRNQPQFSSVTPLCPALCDPMDCSMPGLPVHHQLPEFTQTHFYWVSDAIQSSHPLSPLLLLPSIFPSVRVFSNGHQPGELLSHSDLSWLSHQPGGEQVRKQRVTTWFIVCAKLTSIRNHWSTVHSCSLEQCFFTIHTNPLEILLNCRFWFSRSHAGGWGWNSAVLTISWVIHNLLV